MSLENDEIGHASQTWARGILEEKIARVVLLVGPKLGKSHVSEEYTNGWISLNIDRRQGYEIQRFIESRLNQQQRTVLHCRNWEDNGQFLPADTVIVPFF